MKKLLFEKHLLIFKFLAFMLTSAILLTTANPLTLFAEDAEGEFQYAETILSASPQTYNCKHYDDGLKEAERAGRKGLITNTAEEKFHIYMDINDEFMYDIPEGIPVDVTVEYFDEVKNRAFCLMYDSHNPSPKFTNNNKFWGVSEMVTCSGSGEWKTYTFRLTDLRAINRTNNQADIRVQTWIAGTGEKRGDVVFGSVRVEYAKFASYLELSSVTSQYAGNIFSKSDENINLSFNMTNRAENDGVYGNVGYEVYNRNSNLLFEGSFTEELADGETKSVPVVFENPGKNGLYSIKVKIDSGCVSDLSKTKTFETEIWFSVMDELKIGEGNAFMGVNQQIGMKQRGDREAVAELASRAGFTYLRDDRPKTEYIDGKWCVTEEFKEMYRMLKSYGIEPVLIIDVPYDGKTWPAAGVTWTTNNPPDTDEEIAAYAQYCADVVSDLNGLVKYFEIFNEYNINIKNGVVSASAENYAKMVKAASASMKLANPECTIIGIAAAGSTADGTDRGIDTQFTSGVFENGGFEGLDAISAHPYDFRRYFGVDRFISDANYLKNLVEEFGGGKELWITEFGWGTAEAGTNQSYTREEQYHHMILQATLARSYGLYSPTLYYCLLDMESRVEQDHNWGLLHEWTRTDGNAYTAKEAYIAMAAYNKFFGAAAEPNGIIKKNSTYVFRYSDDTKNRDVALLISEKDEQKIAIDLGTKTAQLYDVFGNKVSDLASNDGVYVFAVSEEPVYIVGNFTKFEDTDIGFNIDFEDNTEGDVNPYELSGTVTNLNGNMVLKLPTESAAYINTEIDAESTGIYELKFSMCPSTTRTFGYGNFMDKILFSFNNGSRDLRIGYFTSASTKNSLYGWKSTHTDLESTAYQTRIINNGPRGKWYNFTVVFDQPARKAIVSVDVEGGVTFDANNTPPITIDLGSSGYLKNFSIKTMDGSETEDKDTCYIDNLSFERVDGLYDSTKRNRILSVSGLKEGMTAVFKSRSLNKTNETDKYFFIIGFYKEDGRMTDVRTGTATITDAANGFVEASFTVPDMTDVSEVRAFLWDDCSTLSPVRELCNPFGNK